MYTCVFVFVQVCVLEYRFLDDKGIGSPGIRVRELGIELRPTAMARALSCRAIFPAP